MTKICLLFILFLSSAGLLLAQTQVILEPSQDNTLYENATGSLSNGGGQYIFAGETANKGSRRALIQFDLPDSIPANAEVTAVSLTLNLNKTLPGSSDQSLHRVTASWLEGSSNASGQEGGGTGSSAGEVTWIHRSFDTLDWAIAGGDFAATASATTNVGAVGSYTWSGPDLIADVESWLSDPASNFGWILIGAEATTGSAKRFDSREASDNRPTLSITYTANTTNLKDLGSLAKISPNPVRDVIQLDFTQLTEEVQVTLSDLSGRTLIQSLLPPNRIHRLPVADLPEGIYVL
ncbi:MAG: DNRLRE domain-containing protein, partial [Bacteroidota bacterium]